MRQRQRERQGADDGDPDHRPPADPVGERAADQRSRGDRGHEHEQVHLRVVHRQLEPLDQVEREIGAEAGRIHVLREHQQHQHRGRKSRRGRARTAAGSRAGGRFGVARVVGGVPHADARKHHHRQQSAEGEPGDRALPPRQDDERGHQGADGAADVAADLEQRLGEAVAPARSHARDARSFWMEHSRADADQRGGEHQHRITVRQRQQNQPDQGCAHADGQRIRLRPPVGVDSDGRLQQRGGELKRQRDQADLGEVQVELLFHQRVQSRNQRLHQIVQHVAEAERYKYRQHRICRGAHRCFDGYGFRHRRDSPKVWVWRRDGADSAQAHVPPN